jgi:hypothetical protein
VQLSVAEAAPNADSGLSREPYGHSGNFTQLGAVFFASVFTAVLSGPHTPATGLPGDWLLKQGIFAGTYGFATNPLDDRYELTSTTFETFRSSAQRSGSGLIPLAVDRDYWAVNAGNPAYRVDWGNIRAEVLWFKPQLLPR